MDRLLGQLLAVCGLVVTLAAAPRLLVAPAQFAPWWSALAAVVVGILLLLAVAGRMLGWRLLRGLWAAAAGLAVLAQLLVFAGYAGAHPDGLRPWVWALEPVMMCLVALLAPLPATAAFAALSAFAPLMSGLLFLGRVPEEVLLQTPVHLGNAAFVAILYGIRSRLLERERIADERRRSDARRLRARAMAARQQALGRIVHDEVLSTLIAATRLPGEPVPELRAAAATALQTLVRAAGPDPAGGETGRMRTGPDDEVGAAEAAQGLSRAAGHWVPASAVRIRSAGGALPRRVVQEAERAMAEALRNSIAHAPEATVRRVEGEAGPAGLRLRIDDDGPGFDIAAVPPERMGVRGSILARMDGLPGGSARIRSGRAGTSVLLEWRR